MGKDGNKLKRDGKGVHDREHPKLVEPEMRYRKGDVVIFVPEERPLKGVITEKNGDTYTILHGGVVGTSTRNGRLRALVGGTKHTVTTDKIMRKTN
jgi:hypothetical protein